MLTTYILKPMQTLLDKFKNIAWTAGKTATTTITTAAMLTGGAIATDQAINKYETVEGERVIQIEEQVEEARVRINKDRPEATLEKWNGEVGMKVSYPQVRSKGSRRAFTNELYYSEGNDTVAMQPVDGGYKIDVVWQDQPATNTVSFDIDGAEELDFFYQPALDASHPKVENCSPTECDTDGDGVIDMMRPENVVGSYAVYHKTKKNHVVGGINYETGKAFHIYRPKVIDDDGNETWGELKYENGQLSVTVDQSFLDKASYPVVVDPTFGYESVGGSSEDIANKWSSDFGGDQAARKVGNEFSLSESGNLSKITAALESFADGPGGPSPSELTIDISTSIQEQDSGGSGIHDVIANIERTSVTVPTSFTWFDFTASGENLSATNYILAALGDDTDLPDDTVPVKGVRIALDTTNNPKAYLEGIDSGYTTLRDEDPWTESWDGASEWTHSIYATYTATAEEVTPQSIYTF